ncbi:MAG: MMPL family transporter [Methylococcaceae bacterium]
MTTPPTQASLGKQVEQKNSFIESTMTFGARRPIIAFLITLIITLITGYGLVKLKIDTDPDSMLNNNNPMLPLYQDVVKEFGSDNIVLVHYQSDDLFSTQKLKVVDEVAYRLQQLSIVEKVETLSTALSIRDNGFGLEINPLVNTYPETKTESDTIKNNALYSPLIKRQLLSADGKNAALLITLRPSFHEAEFNRHAYDEIQQAIAPLNTEFKQVFQVGMPRINANFGDGLLSDIKVITPLCVFTLIISLILTLRIFWAALIPLITSVVSVIWTFGILGYCNIPINLLIAVLPGLIIVIGSTEDTHIVAAYLQGLKHNNNNGQRFPAIAYMARHVGVPIFITSFSTIIGFLSNIITDMTLIRDFAIASSLGMLTTGGSTLLLAPLLLSICGPKKIKTLETTQSAQSNNTIFQSWETYIEKLIVNIIEFHQRKIFITTVIVVLIFGGLALKITANNDPLSYFREAHPLIVDNASLHEQLSGMQVFSLTIEAAQNTDFKNPKQLEKLEIIEQLLIKQGVYDKVTGITDYLKLVNQEMHHGDKSFYSLPKSRELVEQYLMLFQRSDLERVISSDARRANFIIRHNMSSSSILNVQVTKLKTQLTDILVGNRFYLTGKNLMLNEAADSLFASQGYSLILAIVMFCVIMMLLYSSVVAGLVSMLPNVIPIVLMFGTMGLFGIPLNPGTAMVSVIALGIAIDDTIHMFNTYNRECHLDGNQEMAAIRTIKIEAIAVIVTSISLAAGFLTLEFSQFLFIAQFGLLAALTMLTAMITELLLTPVLLKNIRMVGLWDIISFDVDRAALRKSEVFADMSAFQIKRVILLSKVREYQANETIIKQGSMGNELFIILSGQAEVIYEEGEHHKVLAQLAWSDSFGEAGYAGNVKRTATVSVSKDSEIFRVVMLNQELVESAMRFYPYLHAKLNRNISKVLARLLAGKNKLQHSN